jgi:hypothetical protein
MWRTGQIDISHDESVEISPNAGILFPPRTSEKPGAWSGVSSKHESQQLLSDIILEQQSLRIFNQRMISS